MIIIVVLAIIAGAVALALLVTVLTSAVGSGWVIVTGPLRYLLQLGSDPGPWPDPELLQTIKKMEQEQAA